MNELHDRAADFFMGLQDRICAGLGEVETKPFREDCWKHEHEGGGRTRVLEGGKIFEKAGVNFSKIVCPIQSRICFTNPWRRP